MPTCTPELDARERARRLTKDEATLLAMPAMLACHRDFVATMDTEEPPRDAAHTLEWAAWNDACYEAAMAFAQSITDHVGLIFAVANTELSKRVRALRAGGPINGEETEAK